MDQLANKKFELVEKRQEMQDAIMAKLIERNRAENPIEKQRLQGEYEIALNDYDGKGGREIEEEIFQLNKEIMLRERKDLANNFLVGEMVMNDLYNRMIELPEGDPEITSIEERILELENLLKKDKKAMNAEGLSEERVRGGNY